VLQRETVRLDRRDDYNLDPRLMDGGSAGGCIVLLLAPRSFWVGRCTLSRVFSADSPAWRQAVWAQQNRVRTIRAPADVHAKDKALLHLEPAADASRALQTGRANPVKPTENPAAVSEAP
jgi:hypothetical protein